MGNGDSKVKVAFDTLGCKVNQAETEALAQQFAEAGYELSMPGDCDVYVLNTCTVTHLADRKSRHLLRLARRRNPRAVVVAAGCYAGRAPREVSAIDSVDLVVGNDRKLDLPGLLEESGRIGSRRLPAEARQSNGLRTRAFIKVQDGCNSSCSYCVVPLARGRETSVAPRQVVAEVNRLVASGYQEVVLTGVKAGAYRCDGVDLRGLLERVLSDTAVARLRLSSLQPQEISPRLIALWRDSRLCRHFHLSLQSGSDTVLGRMRRRYTVSSYITTINLIRSAVPQAAITTDVIIGFPGETETEWQESYRICREVGFARVHVFPYSPRQGTEAARLLPRVPEAARKERTLKMLALARDSAREFHRRFVGQTMTVLWEKRHNGAWSGLTDNYIRVHARCDDDLTNRLTSARLLAVDGDAVLGAVVPQPG